MPEAPDPIASATNRLERVLGGLDRAAVALSGGVDSTLLAYHVHRTLGPRSLMIHAVSPAVPAEATGRVRRLAAEWGWELRVIDAGEFADPSYLANPVDRCFFCKTNLYGAMARYTEAQLLSGANLDDLGDYRPGLNAAADHQVRHPLVEADIDKATVRLMARSVGLDEVAELPSSPCLSSRLLTGVPVTAERLALVDEVEQLLTSRLGTARTIRCRVLPGGVEIQIDERALQRLGAVERDALGGEIAALAAHHGVDGSVRFAPYRRGSAFVRNRGDAP